MAVTRRQEKSRQPSPIHCVTLCSISSRLGEASEVARAIHQAIGKVSSSL